jgi:hypothetical protein
MGNPSKFCHFRPMPATIQTFLAKEIEKLSIQISQVFRNLNLALPPIFKGPGAGSEVECKNDHGSAFNDADGTNDNSHVCCYCCMS